MRNEIPATHRKHMATKSESGWFWRDAPGKAHGRAGEGGKMRNRLHRLLLCLAFASLAASWAVAQDTNSDSKSKSDVRTITGCLTKGDSSTEFLLTANDGSTWEVHNSDAVNLASHVGHTIAATGVVSNAKMHNLKEDSKEAAKDTGMKKNNTEHGHLKITDVQMVSDSCAK
jgi:hypothetical protein